MRGSFPRHSRSWIEVYLGCKRGVRVDGYTPLDVAWTGNNSGESDEERASDDETETENDSSDAT